MYLHVYNVTNADNCLKRAYTWCVQAASGHSERVNGTVTQFKRPEHSHTEVMKDILWRLATKQLRSGEWKKLAYHWGFTENHVKAIEHQYTGESRSSSISTQVSQGRGAFMYCDVHL